MDLVDDSKVKSNRNRTLLPDFQIFVTRTTTKYSKLRFQHSIENANAVRNDKNYSKKYFNFQFFYPDEKRAKKISNYCAVHNTFLRHHIMLVRQQFLSFKLSL